jgi:hypothetical protein
MHKYVTAEAKIGIKLLTIETKELTMILTIL